MPRYDFNWQHNYKPASPKILPKGTKVEASLWFDNSVNNPANPDATSEVRWGDQSWEEMAIGFFVVAFDPKVDLKDLLEAPKKAGTVKELAAAAQP